MSHGFGPVCGVITGVIASATGVFWCHTCKRWGLNRDELVQALESFTDSTLALAGGLLWRRGALGGGELGASLLAGSGRLAACYSANGCVSESSAGAVSSGISSSVWARSARLPSGFSRRFTEACHDRAKC